MQRVCHALALRRALLLALHSPASTSTVRASHSSAIRRDAATAAARVEHAEYDYDELAFDDGWSHIDEQSQAYSQAPPPPHSTAPMGELSAPPSDTSRWMDELVRREIERQQEPLVEAYSSHDVSPETVAALTGSQIANLPPALEQTELPARPAAAAAAAPPPRLRFTARLDPPCPTSRAPISSTSRSRPTIEPYTPPPQGEAASPAHPYPQPHDYPILSRHDWRLSSSSFGGAPAISRRRPRSLYEAGTALAGHNALLGVGLPPLEESKRRFDDPAEAQTEEEERRLAAERWGWRKPTPDSDRDHWPALDAWLAARPSRLLELTQTSETIAHFTKLLKGSDGRWVSAEERERRGVTVSRVHGEWLTPLPEAESQGAEGQTQQKQQSSRRGRSVFVAAFRRADGEHLEATNGWQFADGDPLRFSRIDPQADQKPTSPVDELIRAPQGRLIEFRSGSILVGFEQPWDLDGAADYRLDLGFDDTAFKIQRKALEQLVYDPVRQAHDSARAVHALQEIWRSAQGQVPPADIREISRRGTSLRELIVPSSQDEAAVDEPQEHQQSALFTNDQLINSWVRRYEREQPLVMPGDPDLGLNASQLRAIACALSDRLSLIQGPPGTGKSRTIVALIKLLKQHFRVPAPILLVAPTHVSIDHLLSMLVDDGLNPLRLGKIPRVRADLQQWTVDQRRERHPMWRRTEEAREASETARKELLAWRERHIGTSDPATMTTETLLSERYRRCWRKFIAYEHRLYSSLFATVDVFCATSIGSGTNRILDLVDFPVVIVDEAAMCTEPSTLVPLMKGAQQATLIGDHKQLPAVVSSPVARRERLHVSLFERLKTHEGVRSVMLDTQYRMHPDIAAFPNLAFYDDELRTAPSGGGPSLQSKYLSDGESVCFIDYEGREHFERQSVANKRELEVVLDIVGDILHRNPTLEPAEIGVISPYAAQTAKLQNIFRDWRLAPLKLVPLLGRARANAATQVEVNTVDGFQGREKRVIILSTVRSNSRGFIGFLSDKRRLNVALTRAKEALFVVGNAKTLQCGAPSSGADGAPREVDPDADPTVWRRYLSWLRERGLVSTYKPSR